MKNVLILAIPVLFTGIVFAQRPDLEGVVHGPDKELLGGATVYVYTAKVKEGTSPYCPSCYLDCGKQATTDGEGRFIISALDPELLFKILVVAQGYKPCFVEDVDPSRGSVVATLSRIPPERLEPGHSVRGRVLDPEGEPVVGATIEIFGRTTENGRMYGTVRGVDPLAISNEQGEFMITTELPNLTLFATVRARGLAPQNCHALSTGSQVHEIRLGHGVTVRAQLENAGRPIDGAVIGVVQKSRDSHDFLGETTIGLGEKGSFEIFNLAPNCDYYVYGKMESLQEKGAVPTRQFRTGDHDSQIDVGSLQLVPGYQVAGRVVLSDGNPIPTKTRIVFSRQDAWDSLFCELDDEGRFMADNLPPEEYGIYVRVKGYRMSAENYSLDPLNRFGLMGVITTNIEDLKILLEPGEVDHSGVRDPSVNERYQKLKTEPIRGIPDDT